MNYRRLLKEIGVKLDDVTEFELPETAAHIRVLESDNKESLFITALDSYGSSKIPMKKFKLICLNDESNVSYTVDYWPKTTFFGDVTIKSKLKGNKIYSCYGLS